jgi:hypothetical protein
MTGDSELWAGTDCLRREPEAFWEVSRPGGRVLPHNGPLIRDQYAGQRQRDVISVERIV